MKNCKRKNKKGLIYFNTEEKIKLTRKTFKISFDNITFLNFNISINQLLLSFYQKFTFLKIS